MFSNLLLSRMSWSLVFKIELLVGVKRHNRYGYGPEIFGLILKDWTKAIVSQMRINWFLVWLECLNSTVTI